MPPQGFCSSTSIYRDLNFFRFLFTSSPASPFVCSRLRFSCPSCFSFSMSQCCAFLAFSLASRAHFSPFSRSFARSALHASCSAAFLSASKR